MYVIVLVCLNSFWPILDFLDFGAPVQTLEKSWNISQIFARFWGKSGNSKEISSLLHRSKEGSGYGSKGGVHESKKIKIGQNVFKQPKTIIESRPDTPQVRTGSVPEPPSGALRDSSGVPPPHSDTSRFKNGHINFFAPKSPKIIRNATETA